MKRVLAIFLTLTVVFSSSGLVAAQPGLNFDNDDAPNPTITEDVLTVAEHDRADMDSPIQYYDDDGEVQTLPATFNDSQDTPVGVRFDQIDADAYDQFPRVDDESGNDVTWAHSSNWSTSSGSNSGMAVSQADSSGIERVNFDASVASGETATATLSDDVHITTDPNKRVLMAVVNVNQLTSGSTVEIRAVDGDGDYRSTTISPGVDADADHTVANSTGNGYVFQQRVSDLALEGSGDGSFDAIQEVQVVTSDSDADVTLSGLDLDSKSERDLGEIQRDGDLESTVIQDYYEGGTADLTGLDTLGAMYDNAVINDLRVYNVEYQFADLTDANDYSTKLSESDYSYPHQLELYGDMEVPSAIDLSHGTLSFEFNQSFVTERYAVAEVATGADDSEAFGNLSSSEYTDWSGQLNGPDTTATVVSNPSADTNYRVHMVVLLQDGDVDALQSTGGAVGPTGSSGGLFGGFFGTLVGQVSGIAGAVLGGLGLRRVFGSG